MNKKLLLAVTGSACLAFSSLALAAPNAKLDGTIDATIKPHSQSKGMLAGAPKHIKLMKIKLSDKAKHLLADRARSSNAHGFNAYNKDGDLPAKVDLGMNNTPVLDQGMHGSCVTFANTGALDAALGKGDYISQTCNLVLGKTLEKDGYVPSGWNGSWGPLVLNQITDFGIINRDHEKNEGCGGLHKYPRNDAYEEGEAMPTADFRKMSENTNYDLSWSSIVSVEDVFSNEYNAEDMVQSVKRALANKHRVTFGVLLDVYVGEAGAIGKYKTKYGFDSWVMTPEIKDDLEKGYINAGHELVIYGYDDDAVAIDEEGNEHKGLFLIRNSWSEFAGYKGDYFMSYEYFRFMNMEAQKIIANGAPV